MVAILEQTMVEKIHASRHILLLTDERLDGDTLGSTLGLYHTLLPLGKKLTVFSPKEVPANLSFIPGVEKISRDEKIFSDESVDLAIICDCSDGEYIKQYLPLLPRPIPLLVFDHHASNPRYGTHHVIEDTAASTADVVWRFLTRHNFLIYRLGAQALLTGVCTDTSLFSTSNTTPAALEAATALTRLGAKLAPIIRATMNNRPLPVLKLWGLLFSRLHHNTEFDALTTAITERDMQEAGNPDFDTSSISNFLNATLLEADTILILRETDDGGVKASLRSRSRDVAELAATYGGGGHKLAAGFKISGAHLRQQNGQWEIARTTENVASIK